jgi:hypothetical protein
MERTAIDNLGIPPLAGLCSYEDACRTGYEVDHNVDLLKRYNYVATRLNAIMAAHLAHTPEWEVKCALSLHMWLDAEHSAALRRRVAEMREPPLHLDAVPDPKLQSWLDETIRAANTVELLVGIYRVAKAELARALRKHLQETNPLVDHPTCRVLRFLLDEQEQMIAWGEQAITALTQDPAASETAAAWEAHLRAFLQDAGGLPGDLAGDGRPLPEPRADGRPYEMDARPQRDERFVDVFNRSAKIDEYWKDEDRPDDERAYALLHKRLREMDVPEWMAPIIYKTTGKPWDYYVDMSRQLWDEARHAMMGEVGLCRDGMPFYQYPVDLQASTTMNLDFEPLEAHAWLWDIEQGLMARETGKHREWAMARACGDALVATFQDYDWADEVLHAQIGRKWLVAEFGTRARLKEFAATTWEKWNRLDAQLLPLSAQEPWWPRFLDDIRRRRARLPDRS